MKHSHSVNLNIKKNSSNQVATTQFRNVEKKAYLHVELLVQQCAVATKPGQKTMCGSKLLKEPRHKKNLVRVAMDDAKSESYEDRERPVLRSDEKTKGRGNKKPSRCSIQLYRTGHEGVANDSASKEKTR
jgi:hypothetical protein